MIMIIKEHSVLFLLTVILEKKKYFYELKIWADDSSGQLPKPTW